MRKFAVVRRKHVDKASWSRSAAPLRWSTRCSGGGSSWGQCLNTFPAVGLPELLRWHDGLLVRHREIRSPASRGQLEVEGPVLLRTHRERLRLPMAPHALPRSTLMACRAMQRWAVKFFSGSSDLGLLCLA